VGRGCSCGQTRNGQAALNGLVGRKKRGYRGRVSRWGSDTSQILQDTQKNWESVGVVFVLRMEGRAGGILTLRAPSRFHAQYIESNNKSKTIEASKIIDQTINHVVII